MTPRDEFGAPITPAAVARRRAGIAHHPDRRYVDAAVERQFAFDGGGDARIGGGTGDRLGRQLTIAGTVGKGTTVSVVG